MSEPGHQVVLAGFTRDVLIAEGFMSVTEAGSLPASSSFRKASMNALIECLIGFVSAPRT